MVVFFGVVGGNGGFGGDGVGGDGTLGATRLVGKVSIDQLTLAGLSTNISVDRPANLGWCMVNPQTS